MPDTPKNTDHGERLVRLETIVQQQHLMVRDHGIKLDDILQTQRKIAETLIRQENLQMQVRENHDSIRALDTEFARFERDMNLVRSDLGKDLGKLASKVRTIEIVQKSRWWLLVAIASAISAAAAFFKDYILP